MKILVLSRIVPSKRKTMDDHLYSFQRYVDGVEFFYCDFFLKLPLFLRLIHWDGIIIHYTLLAERWNSTLWSYHHKYISEIGKLKGLKVAIPQDEYSKIPELQELFKACGMDTVFTCLSPIDYDKVYPLDKTGLKHRFSTFPGFVDEDSQKVIDTLSAEIQSRDIDIGYRARNLPFWLGRHGQIKREIGDKTLQAPNTRFLKLDISVDAKDVFYGNDWLRFLLRCRCVLGCLGGASLFDPHGQFRNQVEAYTEENPSATFEEVEQKIFPGKDYTLSLFALSPRHFECAQTKTCQILFEGDYHGVFLPGRHYIELKKDYSNLNEILEKITDTHYCEQIAENAYREIALSDKYTYKAFANQVIDHIKEHSSHPHTPSITLFICRFLLKLHNRSAPLRYYLLEKWIRYQLEIKPALKRLAKEM